MARQTASPIAQHSSWGSRPHRVIYSQKTRFNHRSAKKTFGAGYMRGREMFTNPHFAGGGLVGTTDKDYFYFLCPACRGVLRWYLLEVVEFERSRQVEYRDGPGQHLVFEIRCEVCDLNARRLKLDNSNWQKGPQVVLHLEPESQVTR